MQSEKNLSLPAPIHKQLPLDPHILLSTLKSALKGTLALVCWASNFLTSLETSLLLFPLFTVTSFSSLAWVISMPSACKMSSFSSKKVKQ